MFVQREFVRICRACALDTWLFCPCHHGAVQPQGAGRCRPSSWTSRSRQLPASRVGRHVPGGAVALERHRRDAVGVRLGGLDRSAAAAASGGPGVRCAGWRLAAMDYPFATDLSLVDWMSAPWVRDQPAHL